MKILFGIIFSVVYLIFGIFVSKKADAHYSKLAREYCVSGGYKPNIYDTITTILIWPTFFIVALFIVLFKWYKGE